ncbi:MAG: hypothetical protein ACOH5I_14325 [Oligoflexus sp.]
MRGVLGLMLVAMFAPAKTEQESRLSTTKQDHTVLSGKQEKKEQSKGRIVFRLYLPKKLPGNLHIELENASPYPLGLVQFSLRVLGQSGELQFDDVAEKQKKSQSVQVENLRELSIEHVIVIDDKATRRSPEIIVQSLAERT